MNKSKPSQFLCTLAQVEQIEKALKGMSLQGHRAGRLALIGRSNVGKSSLINHLLGAKLARISKQPGKTRALHFYLWGEARKIIVDLPGYGYARVSKTERNHWEAFIDHYLSADSALERALVLLDSRHGPTQDDVEVIQFLSLKAIPITVVLTKVDLLKTQSERVLRTRAVHESLTELGVPLDSIFWVSNSTKIGLKQLAQSLGRNDSCLEK